MWFCQLHVSVYDYECVHALICSCIEVTMFISMNVCICGYKYTLGRIHVYLQWTLGMTLILQPVRDPASQLSGSSLPVLTPARVAHVSPTSGQTLPCRYDQLYGAIHAPGPPGRSGRNSTPAETNPCPVLLFFPFPWEPSFSLTRASESLSQALLQAAWPKKVFVYMCMCAYIQIYMCTHLYVHVPTYKEIEKDLGEEIRWKKSTDFLLWKIKASQTQSTRDLLSKLKIKRSFRCKCTFY